MRKLITSVAILISSTSFAQYGWSNQIQTGIGIGEAQVFDFSPRPRQNGCQLTDEFYGYSSAIAGAKYYDCGGGQTVLRIQFTTQEKWYDFPNVDEWTWSEFKFSTSKGKYYNENIRNNY